MKRNEKRGIIISIIVTVMGLIGLIYTTIMKNSIEDYGPMYNLGITYFATGIILIVYFIRLSKNKKKSDEQEIIYEDERLNRNKDRACAITFRIIIWILLIADFMVTFFFRQYQEFADKLNVFTLFSIFTYLIVYYVVSKKN